MRCRWGGWGGGGCLGWCCRRLGRWCSRTGSGKGEGEGVWVEGSGIGIGIAARNIGEGYYY